MFTEKWEQLKTRLFGENVVVGSRATFTCDPYVVEWYYNDPETALECYLAHKDHRLDFIGGCAIIQRMKNTQLYESCSTTDFHYSIRYVSTISGMLNDIMKRKV